MYGAGKSVRRTLRRVTIVVLASLFSTIPVFADSDAEREALARLIHELEALDPLIETAESQANPDARIRFRYDWLRQDLERIRVGIREHIDAPRAEPRTFPPLRGDYRQ
jgi:RAQPRD family integrative conjugative element protein